MYAKSLAPAEPARSAAEIKTSFDRAIANVLLTLGDPDSTLGSIAAAQAEFRAAFTEWPEAELNAYIARHYPAYWLKVELPRKIRHARFLRASEQAGHKLAINVGFDEARGVTEMTILAIDHPWLLSIIAGACASAGANIVDAQIYTTTDGRALDTIAISREYGRDEDEVANSGGGLDHRQRRKAPLSRNSCRLVTA